MVDKRVILSLALLTLVGFPMLGMILVKLFSDQPIQIMLRQVAPIWQQFAFGIGVGTLMGFIAHWLTEHPILRPSTQKYSRLLGALRLNTTDKILISICAGFGEELLFRGAIQYFWGIWITAFFFVAIHGYLSIKDWRISIYGIMMTIFIAIMGYMNEWYGIWAAVSAHAMVDIVLLMRMKDSGPHISHAEVEV